MVSFCPETNIYMFLFVICNESSKFIFDIYNLKCVTVYIICIYSWIIWPYFLVIWNYYVFFHIVWIWLALGAAVAIEWVPIYVWCAVPIRAQRVPALCTPYSGFEVVVEWSVGHPCFFFILSLELDFVWLVKAAPTCPMLVEECEGPMWLDWVNKCMYANGKYEKLIWHFNFEI